MPPPPSRAAGSMLVTRTDRYVMRQLLLSLIAVTGALVALIWLTQSLRFVELVVNRGLSLRVFLELTSLLIPNFVAVILPITTFVVVQFVYQRLQSDRELTVMRAAGLSPWALARPAVRVALLAMAACFVLNMYVVPASFAAFRQFEFEIRNRVAAFLLQEGVFTTMSDNLMVYVRKRDPDGILHGIFVDDQRDHANPATIIAERGELDPDPNGSPRVVLWNGTRQVLDKRTGRLNILSFTQNAVELTTAGAAEEQRYRDVAEMSMRELLDPPAGIVSARDLPKLAVEAQRRLSAPFTALSFTFVALVAVLRGTFRRHGNIVRPAGAVLAVVGLLALGLAATNLAQRQPLLLPLLWVQAIAPGVVCAAWLLGGLLWPRRLRPLRLPQAEAA